MSDTASSSPSSGFAAIPGYTPWPAIPDLSALRFISRADACPMEAHIHPGQIEINYMVRGHISWWVGDEDLTVTGGDVHIHRPDEPHGGVNDTFEPMTFYGAILRVPADGSGMLDLPEAESRALVDQLRGLPRQFRARPNVGELFKQAFEAGRAPQTDLNALALRGKLIALLVEILASACDAGRRDRRSALVQRALEMMRANLSEPLALEEIADAVGLSLSHFKARFRREAGTTPAKEYLRLRVMEGVDRLASGGRSVTDVAYALGFSSSQHFATCVRRVTGHAPRAFLASPGGGGGRKSGRRDRI